MLPAEIVEALRQAQKMVNDRLLAALEPLQQGHGLAAYAGLMTVAFLYGIIHAIGPGHGKLVVGSYMLANENSLKRGLAVTALAALLQAVMACALVLGFFHVLEKTRAEAEQAAVLLELCSFALIALLGLGLMAQGIRTFGGLFARPSRQGRDHHHGHGGACSSCGHAHAPAPGRIPKSGNLATLAVMVLSIGIRPCTGALLLLYFATAFSLTGPGIAATFAMALGTAMTTGTLALLAVKSRHLAQAFVKNSEKGLRAVQAGLRFGGGCAVFAIAGLFFMANLNTPSAFTAAPQPHPLYRAFR